MRYKVFKYASVNDEIEEVIKYYESVSDSLGKRVEDEIYNEDNIRNLSEKM